MMGLSIRSLCCVTVILRWLCLDRPCFCTFPPRISFGSLVVLPRFCPAPFWLFVVLCALIVVPSWFRPSAGGFSEFSVVVLLNLLGSATVLLGFCRRSAWFRPQFPNPKKASKNFLAIRQRFCRVFAGWFCPGSALRAQSHLIPALGFCMVMLTWSGMATLTEYGPPALLEK